jgi:hypothetical protein
MQAEPARAPSARLLDVLLILRLAPYFFPGIVVLSAIAIALGGCMLLFGHSLAKPNSALADLGGVLLVVGCLQLLVLLIWAFVSLRIARKISADPDTRITFRDNEVTLYRPAITVREKVIIHNREVESETTIRKSGFFKLPGWIMDDPRRYGLKLPSPEKVEK